MKKGNDQEANDHTIDNLCKRDKNKMIELLKQLNELKKRCAFLDSSINNQNLENQRVEIKNDVISKQIEDVEHKFNESSNISKEYPKQFEEFTLAIQVSETECANLRAQIEDSESQAAELREVLNILNSKYNRIYKDASVSCFAKCKEKETNTDDVTQNYVDCELQIPERKVEKDFLYEDFTTNNPIGTYFDAPDDEITSLIAILNQH